MDKPILEIPFFHTEKHKNMQKNLLSVVKLYIYNSFILLVLPYRLHQQIKKRKKTMYTSFNLQCSKKMKEYHRWTKADGDRTKNNKFYF